MIFRSTVLLLLSQIYFSSPKPQGEQEHHRVVIVGAGVSGFAAAAALLADNFTDFIVLEAADRIGGRIHTVEFGGVAIDKGAEFVHGEKDNAVFELVSPHGLLQSYNSLVPVEKLQYYNISGDPLNNTLVHSVTEEAFDILEGDYGGFNGSLAEFFYPKLKDLLVSHGVGPELGEGIKHLIEESAKGYVASDTLEEVGTVGEARWSLNDGDQHWKWKPGTQGYKTIFDILSRKYPMAGEDLHVADKVALGKEVVVVQLDEESGSVVLSCADGSSYSADHVIVTVSLGVLKKRAADMFVPPLPPNKTDAITTLGIGCVGKVFLLFPTRWWPNDFNAFIPLFSQKQYEDFKKNTTHGYWTADNNGFLPVMNHDRMLEVWFVGPSCRTMESLTDEEVVDGEMELLNAFIGKHYEIPRPEAVLRTNWASNPYTLGSYSFHTVDSDRLNITRKHLSDPVMRGDKPVVMFAGEATDDSHWSTVHGALSSGRREAARLLQYLRAHS